MHLVSCLQAVYIHTSLTHFVINQLQYTKIQNARLLRRRLPIMANSYAAEKIAQV